MLVLISGLPRRDRGEIEEHLQTGRFSETFGTAVKRQKAKFNRMEFTARIGLTLAFFVLTLVHSLP
jgi:hypothetical protein